MRRKDIREGVMSWILVRVHIAVALYFQLRFLMSTL